LTLTSRRTFGRRVISSRASVINASVPSEMDKFPKLNRFLTGYDLRHVFNDEMSEFDLTRILTGRPCCRSGRSSRAYCPASPPAPPAPPGYRGYHRTSNRATLGGMINTDASGQGSLVYGKTSDHVLGLRVISSRCALQRW
jgi:FAD/FMN-containing dehydrogenase